MTDGASAMYEEEMLEHGWHEYADKYDQPPPMPNDLPAIWELVVDDLEARADVGLNRYGTHLQPHNGRDPILDLYQELQDGLLYLRQFIYERDGK